MTKKLWKTVICLLMAVSLCAVAALCACGGSNEEERDATNDDIDAFKTAVAYASDYHDGYTLAISTSYFYIRYDSDGELYNKDDHTIEETVSSKRADSDFLIEYAYVGSTSASGSISKDYVHNLYMMQDESVNDDSDDSSSLMGYYNTVDNLTDTETKGKLSGYRLETASDAYEKYSDFSNVYGYNSSILTLSSIKTYMASYCFSVQSSAMIAGDLTYETESGASVYNLIYQSSSSSGNSISTEETISFYIKNGKIIEITTAYKSVSYYLNGKLNYDMAYENDIKITYSYSKNLMPTDFSDYR